jgi:hypothetical protein
MGKAWKEVTKTMRMAFKMQGYNAFDFIDLSNYPSLLGYAMLFAQF